MVSCAPECGTSSSSEGERHMLAQLMFPSCCLTVCSLAVLTSTSNDCVSACWALGFLLAVRPLRSATTGMHAAGAGPAVRAVSPQSEARQKVSELLASERARSLPPQESQHPLIDRKQWYESSAFQPVPATEGWSCCAQAAEAKLSLLELKLTPAQSKMCCVWSSAVCPK